MIDHTTRPADAFEYRHHGVESGRFTHGADSPTEHTNWKPAAPKRRPGDYPADWREKLAEALAQMARGLESNQELLRLRAEVAALANDVATLKAVRPGLTVPVQTFAPEPYDLREPLLVVVRPEGDEFTACFLDANLTAHGDNEAEAVDNLKALILDTLDNLARPGRKLGPVPAGQLTVIREFVAKRG